MIDTCCVADRLKTVPFKVSDSVSVAIIQDILKDITLHNPSVGK